MRTLSFMKRTGKEILLDPLTIVFGLGFPVVLLLLMSTINSAIPKGMGPDIYEIENLTPGISVFGLSFITLMSALLLSKDRTSSLLQRLLTTPLTAVDYLVGYTLPLIPIGLAQSIICYILGLILGLEFSLNIFAALLAALVTTIFFTAMGLAFGSILNEKQVGGLCGALVTNLTAWLSGAWIPLDLVGGVLKTIAQVLPFYHAVEIQRAILQGNYDGVFAEGHIWILLGYTVAICVISVILFTTKMREK